MAALTVAGCRSYNRDNIRFTHLDRIEMPGEASAQTLNVRFLGTAGIYLQGQGVSLLADPFFTNPGLLRTIWPFPTASNEKRIDSELSRLPGIDQLQAVLVTHSHYDHAMDLPYVISRFQPKCIYGSPTLADLLGPDTSGLCALHKNINDPTQLHASWIPSFSRLHIAAIEAQHFPHALGWTYAKGLYKREPSRLYDWRAGATYSFVIDILDGNGSGQPVFRIFYMPSAATHPIGTPPSAILDDGKRVDLAILGAAQLDKDNTYPGAILRRIQPAAVMLVHWDNFFDGYKINPRLNFRVDPDEIAERITEAVGTELKVYWPERGAVLSCQMARQPELPVCRAE